MTPAVIGIGIGGTTTAPRWSTGGRRVRQHRAAPVTDDEYAVLVGAARLAMDSHDLERTSG